MLNLQHAYPGDPSSTLHHLRLPHETLLLYPSVDSVVILNAQSLALVRVLAFWEAFPGAIHTKDRITCISVDSDMKLIVAALGCRVASWVLSGTRHDTWRVHSSLVSPESCIVTSLHNKSGLLAIGMENGLAVHTLILDNDLPTWSQKWIISTKTTSSLVRFAPSLTHIATVSKEDSIVRLYSTTTGKIIQSIRHPRPITNILWRVSNSGDDLILYTITECSTLRIFLPVLDDPQHLQLHISLDLSLSSAPQSKSVVFWLDKDILHSFLQNILKVKQKDSTRTKRLHDIVTEGWDLFLRIVSDGTIIVSAVTNIDRRPPTLLNHFTLQECRFPDITGAPQYLYILPTPDNVHLTLVTSSPLSSFNISPLEFFDADSNGLCLITRRQQRAEAEERRINRFIRTPEGHGVAVIREGGSGEIWKTSCKMKGIKRSGSWSNADFVVVLNEGRHFATYTLSSCTLTLHSVSSSSITLPKLISLFTVPSKIGTESIIAITEDLEIFHISVAADSSDASISNSTRVSLPLPKPPQKILPVDPMAWGLGHPWTEHDIILSVSQTGELAFWVIEENIKDNRFNENTREKKNWKCTGQVHTYRQGFTRCRCSSAKKTAMVVPGPNGIELSIWDSKESEFASGLEYCRVFEEHINDLDWTSTPDMQSILAVGYLHHIDLLCQQRMTYFDDDPGWQVCWKVDISSFIPYEISDSIWLANGAFLVGAGHEMLLYTQPPPNHKIDLNPTEENLFEYVALTNGPLPDYHPQMLLQCLLWNKIELVKEIIMNLAHDMNQRQTGSSEFIWTSLPTEKFIEKEQTSGHSKRYTMLFDEYSMADEYDYLILIDATSYSNRKEEGFSRAVVIGLIEKLEMDSLPHLTPNEQAHLLVIIQTTLEIDEQRRALDANGLRYLISMKSYYILNSRALSPESPESHGVIPRKSAKRERLRYRDMTWAFYSESQQLLLEASTAACNGKMVWSDAKALGVPIWLNSVELLKSQVEIIARNEYMNESGRDPSACSLLYFALGKVKLVHGLWRQASGHKEQPMMLKFLSNDFKASRWKTAALKNGYALLSKRRFEYAAAFFLLGGSLKDAVNVCLRQLNDVQLAIVIARVVEQSNEGPIFLDILKNSVVPLAFTGGNRWLGCWAFWLLKRRDLAVQILVSPLQDVIVASGASVDTVGEPHYDDPSLALLFSQLKSKTLQTAKGASEISGRSEFNFVLQTARIFCRMGCHALALDLVRSWSFERPSTVERPTNMRPTRPSISRRSSIFPLEPALRRQRSMFIDMDIQSLPSTRATSPSNALKPPMEILHNQDAEDILARKAGLGNLMKTAKQDVKVPEFDMNAFF